MLRAHCAMENVATVAASVQARLGVSPAIAQVVAWVIVLLVTYACVKAAQAVTASIFGTKSGSRGNLLLLIGQSGAGKTALFYQLRDNEDVQTVSSMKAVRDKLQIKCGDDEFSIETVDCPGHPRLRRNAADLLKEARCIVYVVDAANKAQLKDVSEHLYELFTSKEMNNNPIPMILACNKSDLSAAKTEKSILDDIEREIEQMRVSRGATLQGEDQADSYLGVDGEKFKLLEHAPCPIQTCRISAKKPSLEPLYDFLRQSFA